MRRRSFTFPVSTLVGSSIPNILAIFRNHKPEPGYYLKLTLTVLIAGIFEILNAWERLRWRKKIREARLEKPPVFIIGFWRSGTTLLHNLLCQDPDASYTTTLQTVFPNLVLSQKGWLKPLVNLLLPPVRPFDNVSMDMDFPQEEEFGLVNLQSRSLYNFFLFPGDFDAIAKHEASPETSGHQHLTHWMKQYHQLIAKAGLNTGGSRYIGKNPCNLARIKLLKQMYPQAKFIFIYRNPYRVVESLYRFYMATIPGVQLQKCPADFSREKIVTLYVSMMQQYQTDKTLLPAHDLIEIKMEEFLQDKISQIGGVYNAFNLGNFDQARIRIDRYLLENAAYSRESYDIHPDTFTLVNRYASDIVTQLGYPLQMS